LRIKSKCSVCEKEGATIRCSEKSCNKLYHFNCAYTNKCTIVNNLFTSSEQQVQTTKSGKRIFSLHCSSHEQTGEISQSKEEQADVIEQEGKEKDEDAALNSTTIKKNKFNINKSLII